jgi:hypothetical protein
VGKGVGGFEEWVEDTNFGFDGATVGGGVPDPVDVADGRGIVRY